MSTRSTWQRPHAPRDLHGRGPRGPLFLPGVPAWRTRRERFDHLVAQLVASFATRWPAVESIEFGIEEVPPSSPAPWEHYSVVFGRVFPADRRRGLRDRIVVYRMPIVQRCHSPQELAEFTRRVLLDRISHVLSIPPDDLF